MGSGFTIDVVVQFVKQIYKEPEHDDIETGRTGGLPGTGGSKELHRVGTATNRKEENGANGACDKPRQRGAGPLPRRTQC